MILNRTLYVIWTVIVCTTVEGHKSITIDLSYFTDVRETVNLIWRLIFLM